MIARQLLAYRRGLLRKLRQDFRLSSKYQAAEGIHELRVDIKRLRVFLSLASEIDPGLRVSDLREPVQKLFKRAGRLRDLQIQSSLTRQYLNDLGLELSEFVNYTKQREMKARRKFAAQCEDFDMRPLRDGERSLQRRLSVITEDALRNHIESHWRRLLGTLMEFSDKAEFEEGDYHKIRMLAKEARYALEIHRQCSASDPAADALDRRLMGIHQALGAWHDHAIVLRSLQDFVAASAEAPLGCEESYRRMAGALAAVQKAQAETFHQRWQQFTDRQKSTSELTGAN